MPDDTDLSLSELVTTLAELDLHQVTVFCNDWGDAQPLVSPGDTDRVANLVLVSCGAFDNYPPGLAGRLLCATASLPGGSFLTLQLLRPAGSATSSWPLAPCPSGGLSIPFRALSTTDDSMSHPDNTVYDMERTSSLRGPKALRALDRGAESRNSMPIADVCEDAVTDSHTRNDHQHLTVWFRDRPGEHAVVLVLQTPISFARTLGTTYSPGLRCWSNENVYQRGVR